MHHLLACMCLMRCLGTEVHTAHTTYCGCRAGPCPFVLLSFSARSSHVEQLRELITHHVLHPAPFFGCRTAAGHAPVSCDL
ncbi:hypothetical protein F5883DRAFT_195723 [Diaporthe sp. PMI_573]|nr:hypothetical protein F5883DRAFT_195723 [Diaporthaceae sp. PMI_573]